jgi:hypothetical protein
MFDPGRNMGMTVQDGLVLGTTVTVNGTFDNFTLNTFDSTKGLWIFDSFYDLAEGGVAYLGQDWTTTTTATASNSNDASDYTPNANVTLENEMIAGDSTIKATITSASGEMSAIRNGAGTPGKTYRITYYAKSDSVDISFAMPDDGYGWYTKTNPALSASWQYYEYVFIAKFTSSKKLFVFTSGTVNIGDIVNFKSITVEEFSAGNHVVDHGDNITFFGTDGLTGTSNTYRGGNALAFDGVADHFYIPEDYANTDFNPGTDDFTVEIWFNNPLTAAGSDVLIAKGEASGAVDNGWELFSTTSMFFRMGTGAGTIRDASYNPGGSGYRDGEWHLATAVRDSNIMYLYMDGVVVDTAMGSDIAASDVRDDNQPLTIGARGDHGFEFEGHIGSAAFHKQALTPLEVAKQWGLGVGWTTRNTTGGGHYNDSWKQSNAEPVGESDGTIEQTYTSYTVGDLYRLNLEMQITPGTANVYVDFGSHIIRPLQSMDKDDPARDFVYYSQITATTQELDIRTYTQSRLILDNIAIQKINNVIPTSISADSTSADYVGTNTGTMLNGMYSNQPGHPSAFVFDGVGDVINLSEKLGLGTNDFIIWFWIYSTDWDNGGTGYRDVIGNFQSASDSWVIRHGSDEIYWWSEWDNNISTIFTNTGGFIDDTWYFCAMVNDRSESDGSKWYVNMVEIPLLADTQLDPSYDIGDADWTNLPEIGNVFSGDGYAYGWQGMTGVHVFDGQNGRPAELPSNHIAQLNQIYTWTKLNRYGYTTYK